MRHPRCGRYLIFGGVGQMGAKYCGFSEGWTAATLEVWEMAGWLLIGAEGVGTRPTFYRARIFRHTRVEYRHGD